MAERKKEELDRFSDMPVFSLPEGPRDGIPMREIERKYGNARKTGLPVPPSIKSLEKDYVRITFLTGDPPKKRTAWAIRLGPGRYRVVRGDGEETNEYVLLGPGDLLKQDPAHMNSHYGELQV